MALAFCLALTEKISAAVCWYFISYPTCVRVYFIENDKEVLQLLGAFRKDLTTYYKSAEGVNFVFGGFKFVDPKTHHSSFSVLLPIVFISKIIGILQYTRILPWIINVLGFLISKINGMGRLESYNAVAAAILGQSEVFISLKQQLPYIPKQRLYTLTPSKNVYSIGVNYWCILHID